MRKNFLKRNLCCLISSLCLTAHTAVAGDLDISYGKWQITFDESSKTVTYVYQDLTLLKKVFVQAVNANGEELKSNDYPNATLKKESISDVFGDGEKYTYIYSGLSGKESLEQVFYFYPSQDYLLTEAFLVSDQQSSCNWIAPIMTKTSSTFLPAEGDNRLLYVPFDNDSFRGYSANPWGISSTSCEVTAIYDVISRQGLCLGSIEHDNWKTGINYGSSSTNRLRSLEVFGGLVDANTNDVRPEKGPAIYHHGSLKGKRIKSPKILVGYFNDWRKGLETIGEATALVTPPLSWQKGTIFAWQSWGGMAEKVNYEGAIDVSDYFKSTLQPQNFHNENGKVYMVLDSYWDNFSEQQLKDFVKHCETNGQIPGIYWTPFSFWGSATDDWDVEGTNGKYKYSDIIITAGGERRKIESYALDPTHPGTLARIDYQVKRFKDWGFKYVKIDFINNGTLEADKFYNPDITTGIQAYNYGMQYFVDACGEDMFIDLSIAPIFPSQYGHARRISCDAWGTIDNSQYMLNSLTFGWWLDRVYSYNDPDHLVFKDCSEGANRIRLTTGAMTGTMLLGDNFSLKGSFPGTQTLRTQAEKVATNADINAVAQLGRSFSPVEGNMSVNFSHFDNNYGVDKIYMLDTKNAFYLVVFNYDTSKAATETVSLSRLGLNEADVKHITELWTGESINLDDGNLKCTVPAGDVRLYRLEKEGWSTGIVTETDSGTDSFNMFISNGSLVMQAPKPVYSASVYSIDGRLHTTQVFSGSQHEETLDINALPEGFYILKATLTSKQTISKKFVK